MKVLVTGGAGFIGYFVLKSLIESGYDVYCMVRKTTNIWRIKHLVKENKVKLVYGDILKPESLKRKFNGIDVIIHVAGLFHHKKRGLVYKTLAEGSKYVFEESLRSKVSKVIHISSAYVTAYNDRIVKEDDPFYPVLSEYGYGKVSSEIYAKRFISMGLDITIIRPGVVYGPFDTRGWISFIEIASNKFLPIGIGNPKAKFNPIFVRDVADAIVKAIDYGMIGEAYLIAGDEVISIGDFYKFLKGTEPLIYISYSMLRSIMFKIREMMVNIPYIDPENIKILYKGMIFSNKKAKRELKWAPKYTLKKGLKITKRWIKIKRKLKI